MDSRAANGGLNFLRRGSRGLCWHVPFGKELFVLTITQIAALNAPVEPVIPLPETLFVASPTGLSLAAPPYSSMIDDVLIQNAIHKYKDKLRQIALHPVKLHAGQSAPPNGGIGRFATPRIPEIIGGGLVGINL